MNVSAMIDVFLIGVQTPLALVSDLVSDLVWRRVLDEKAYQEFMFHWIASYKVIEDYFTNKD